MTDDEGPPGAVAAPMSQAPAGPPATRPSPLDRAARRVRDAFLWLWSWGDEDEGDRGVLLRILLTMIWLPFQITLSLIFATGGIFFLLIAGVIFGPFIGLWFLIRHLARGASDGEPDGLT